MPEEIKRYRIRPKTYLCLYPEEALSSGISTSEETLEELTLVISQGFGYSMYAVLKNLSEEKLREIPIHERGEKVFENRREAVNYIKRQGDGNFLLYGVTDLKIFDRREAKMDEENSLNDTMDELKKFNV